MTDEALDQSQIAAMPVTFSGDGDKFFSLCARGAGMQLVTFGFYRFWLATNIRRALWTATSIRGEALEYTGRGRELLMGFLIALAIILPVNFIYFLIGIEAERLKAFASFPLILFFMMFGQFAVYRARRYRLTRTVYRGVRFWMQGSGWAYAFRWLGWAILTALTLGFAYPWMRASLERYKMRNTFYGDLQGRFEGRGARLFRRGFGYWFFGLSVLACLLAGAVTKSPAMREYAGFSLVFVSLGVIGGIAFVFSWPSFRAMEWRWWAEGVRFGAVAIKSDIRGSQFLFLYITAAFASFAALFGLSIVIGIMTWLVRTLILPRLGIDFAVLQTGNALAILRSGAWLPVAAGFFGNIFVALSIGVIIRYFLTFRMWDLIAGSLTVTNLSALDGVAARGDAANAIGEGLADSLDVAGF